VIVPYDVAAEVRATASAGDVVVFGLNDDGTNAKVSGTFNATGADDTVHIDAHVGLGQVVVERALR
jgi:predicted membrane protein